MLRRRERIVWFILALMLALPVALLGAASELQGRRLVAQMEVGPSRIDWLPQAEYESLVLTISGPGDLFIRNEAAPGQTPTLTLVDSKGNSLPDGSYAYELRAVPRLEGEARGKLPERPLVQSGHFFIKDGSFVAVLPKPPLRRITEELSDDDLIINGNACIGPSCNPNITDNDYPVLKLKGPQPNILFDDIEIPETFNPAHDWALFANPFEAAQFSIADFEGQLIPFSIMGGAPDNSLVIGSNGNIGLGTSTPAARLHILSSTAADAFGSVGPDPVSGPAFNFGYGGATWGRGAGFLNVRPDASATAPNPSLRFLTANAERMIITNAGNVGIGTTSPSTPLHVRRSDGTAKVLVEEASGTAATRLLFQLQNNGSVQFNYVDTSLGVTWGANVISGNYRLVRAGSGVIASELQGNGNLTLAGILTQNSDRNTKHDIVPVQSDEILNKTLSLPIATWVRNGDDSNARHLGPMAQDFASAFGLGEDERHIATLDMAGVSLASIQALNSKMTTALAAKDTEIATLRRENSDLAQRLATLEKLVSTLMEKEAPAQAEPAP